MTANEIVPNPHIIIKYNPSNHDCKKLDQYVGQSVVIGTGVYANNGQTETYTVTHLYNGIKKFDKALKKDMFFIFYPLLTISHAKGVNPDNITKLKFYAQPTETRMCMFRGKFMAFTK